MASKPEGTRLFDSIIIECECGRRLRSEEVLRAYFTAQRRASRRRDPEKDRAGGVPTVAAEEEGRESSLAGLRHQPANGRD
jgi:hypothetical protein